MAWDGDGTMPCVSTSADEHLPAGESPHPPAPVEGRRTQEGAGRSPVRAGSRVVIIGGGPGGYEAALVAAQLGARVCVVERQGMGGAAGLDRESTRLNSSHVAIPYAVLC